MRQVTQVDNYGTPGVSNVVLASAYDANGNRTQLAATVNSTADFTNSYDGIGRLTDLTHTKGRHRSEFSRPESTPRTGRMSFAK